MTSTLFPKPDDLWTRMCQRMADPSWTHSDGVRTPAFAALAEHPDSVFAYLNLDPDPWQKQLLESHSRQLLVCCSRQTGKSLTAAAKALHTALVQAPATVLIVSRAQRQSAELMRKVKEFYAGLRGEYVRRKNFKPRSLLKEVAGYAELSATGLEETTAIRDSVLSLEMQNGSRIICLPGTAETIVGFSAIDLLIIDEAARTRDELYASLRPTLAVSKGQLLVLSTPFGKRGWFWTEWDYCDQLERAGKPCRWERIKATVHECPRIDKDWLADEQASIGERWFRQEYMCSFEDTVDAVFAHEDIHAMVSEDIEPLWS